MIYFYITFITLETITAIFWFMKLSKRVAALELNIVRSVMEEENYAAKVLATYEKLVHQFSGRDAMREARRLYGLEP